MKKVAILTNSLLSWNGGKELLHQIMLSLSVVADARDLELYAFVSDRSARRARGVSRLWESITRSFGPRSRRLDSFPGLELFPRITLIACRKRHLFSVIRRLGIDAVLPYFGDEGIPEPVPGLRYLYDCQHRHLPELFTDEEFAAREALFTAAVRQTRPLIVNARSVKLDLVTFFGADASSVHVLPFTPKLVPSFFDALENSSPPDGHSSRYFLISNQFWVHKDHRTAIIALAKLREDPSFHDVTLACTGALQDSRRPEHVEDLRAFVEKLNLSGAVRFLGLIPKAEQLCLMRHAVAVVQPTLFEGGPGGGSVSDALSLGVRCIVSDIRPNREIERPEITLFRAGDPSHLADKMKAVLQVPHIPSDLAELRARSLRNAERLGHFLVDLL